MSMRQKYGLVFVEPAGKSRGRIYWNNNSIEINTLAEIGDIHISECEYLIEEIDNALKNEFYERTPSFDWADLDIELKYPHVILSGTVVPMDDFRLLLREWIDFNSEYNEDIL